MSEIESLANGILEYVKRTDWVSFAEIRNRFGGDGRLDGDETIGAPGNIIFWAGMSTLFSEAILQLAKKREVFFWPSEPMVYLIDGGLLRLPLAKRPPAVGYKDPHWAPVTIRTVEHPKARKAKTKTSQP